MLPRDVDTNTSFREVGDKGGIFKRTDFIYLNGRFAVRRYGVTVPVKRKRGRAGNPPLHQAHGLTCIAPFQPHNEVDKRAAVARAVIYPKVLFIIHFHTRRAVFAQRGAVHAVISPVFGRADAQPGEVIPYRERVYCLCVHDVVFFVIIFSFTRNPIRGGLTVRVAV